MRIDFKSGEIEAKEYDFLTKDGFIVYWKGLIWKYKKKAGKDTIEDMIDFYKDNRKIMYKEYFGAFAVIIVEPSGRIVFFCDNSGLQGIWVGATGVSDNLIEYLKLNKVKAFNEEALNDFIVLGGTYFGESLLEGVYWCDNEKVYWIEDGELSSQEKGIGKIYDESSVNGYEEFFENLAYSLSETKTTMSLTGGYDSRMILAGLHNYMDINTFISGDNEKDVDIICAGKAASACGRVLERIPVDKIEIDEVYLRKQFEEYGGMRTVGTSASARVYEFIKTRIQEGYDLYITGDGGTLHKDWYWIQDFPFYHKKTINLEKYYKQRIVMIDEEMSTGARIDKERVKRRFIEKLRQDRQTTNTESYDYYNFYYYQDGYKFDGTSTTRLIDIYSPLRELELVKLSYHLPRRKRFFYNKMREVTTNCCPELARVKTSYGTTASSEFRYILRDIWYQTIDYFKKACRLFSRTFFKKSCFIGHVMTYDIEKEVRALDLTQKAIEYGKKAGLIQKNVQADAIQYSLLVRVLNVYLLSEHMCVGGEISG